MSASSFCVTCGIDTQLRCRNAPGELLDARQRLRLDRPELGEIDLRQRRQVEAEPAAAAAPRGCASAAFTNACTSSLRMRPFGPLPLTLAEIDAELAREAAHRRAGVRFGETRFVDWRGGCRGARGAAGAAAPRARRGAAAGAAAARSRRGAAGAGCGLPARPSARRRSQPPSADFEASARARPCETLSPTLTLHLLHHAARRRGHFHRRLVDSSVIERVLGLDAVARLHQHLDHRHVLEVADVGNDDFFDGCSYSVATRALLIP